MKIVLSSTKASSTLFHLDYSIAGISCVHKNSEEFLCTRRETKPAEISPRRLMILPKYFLSMIFVRNIQIHISVFQHTVLVFVDQTGLQIIVNLFQILGSSRQMSTVDGFLRLRVPMSTGIGSDLWPGLRSRAQGGSLWRRAGRSFPGWSRTEHLRN